MTLNLVHACFSVRRDLESSVHHCGGPVELVQASLGVSKNLECIFHHPGGILQLFTPV